MRSASAETRPSTEQPCQEIGLVAHDGAERLRLRSSPETAGDNVIGELPFNTRLQVGARVAGGWLRVTTPTGATGYVAALYVRTALPEPTATLHRVEAGARGTAIGIAEQHYRDQARDWGQDLRFYVNVLAHLNGVAVPDRVDGWKQVQFHAGRLLWVPSPAFAQGLVGVVSSGSRTYAAADAIGIADGIERMGQGFADMKAAVRLAGEYMGEAIGRHVTEAFVEVLAGLALTLAGSALLLLLSTAVGAGLGALAGGAGAAPGAAAGFEAGLAIIEWLGLAFLLAWAGTAGIRVGAALGEFIGIALAAEGDARQIDRAARALADAVGTALGVLVEALVLLGAAWGVPRVLAALRGSRFGAAIGETALGAWLSARVARHAGGEGPLRGPNHPRHTGRPDAAHEQAQGGRWVRAEHGGGHLEWLGNNQMGIEGFWTPRGSSEKLPFSLKDYSGKGKMRNVIGDLNDNASKIVRAGFSDVTAHVRLKQWTVSVVRAFVKGGPIERMPGEGAFGRIVFDCANGVFAIGRPSAVPFPLPAAPIGPMPYGAGESHGSSHMENR